MVTSVEPATPGGGWLPGAWGVLSNQVDGARREVVGCGRRRTALCGRHWGRPMSSSGQIKADDDDDDEISSTYSNFFNTKFFCDKWAVQLT